MNSKHHTSPSLGTPNTFKTHLRHFSLLLPCVSLHVKTQNIQVGDCVLVRQQRQNKLTEYFEPQKNRRYEVFKFREAKQEAKETLDQNHIQLPKLAKTCTFADEDFEIEQQILMAGTSSRIRKRALRDPTYTLKHILVDG